MKIQTRIASLFVLLAGGILLVVSMLLYYLINQNTFEDFYKRLEIRAIVIARGELDANANSGKAYAEIKRQYLEDLPGEREYIFNLDTVGVPTIRRRLPGVTTGLIGRAIQEGNSRWRKGENFYYMLHYETDAQRYLIVISAHNALSVLYLKYLRQALLISFFVACVAALLVGMVFSRAVMKPIRVITAQVKSLTAGNLHLRLDAKQGTDEVAELSATFNDMLDRMETAFETQNNFVSHASHEFNTPLTSILGEAEYALAKPRTAEQYVAALNSINTSAEKLSSITSSLLQLAQTGLTGKVQQMTALRIDDLIQTVIKMTERIMPGCDIRLNYSLQPADAEKLVAWGNQTLLELALANVVLNACKYSSNAVQVGVAATNNMAIIIVKDEGIGIPEKEMKYIFDPFFRASNTNPFKGYGIGLPLTRNIIRIHKGELIVKSVEHKGTEIQIKLPLASSVQ
jgi:signal transduction histidine kinase